MRCAWSWSACCRDPSGCGERRLPRTEKTAGGSVTFPRCYASIGVFDGCHRGHQLIFQQVLSRAADGGGRPVVVTFDPYPGEVLAPERPAARLQSAGLKRRFLLEMGFRGILELVFSRAMARMEPRDFVEQVLLAHLDLVELHIGYDFRFGRDRGGGIEELESLGRSRGFQVTRVPALLEEGLPISSSRLRRALRDGDVEAAWRWLGRPHCLEGEVVRGRGEGSRILFPTANLKCDPRILLPRCGVYVVEAEVGDEVCGGVMNIGRRPTVTGGDGVHVEVHLFDWDRDVAGRTLQVFLLGWLRPEEHFASVDALRAAIAEDIARGRAHLSRLAQGGPAVRG
ncbi:MAG: riboflavin biosynthesis protein RibF [Candidatus Eisenbacteria bacterium]|nr:riboflavin biosynthesis protein RibF [Candidatus Eisenbacteria bacterium]